MALAFVAASSEYLSQAAGLLGDAPCSIALWYNPTNNTGAQVLFCQGSSSTVDQTFLDNNSGNANAVLGQATKTAVTAASVASLTASGWNHLAASFNSATSVTVFLNGVAATATGTSNVPVSMTETVLGALLHSGTVLDFANGSIAYPAAWSGYALTQTDVNNLYNSGSGSDPRNLSTPPNASFSLLTGTAPFPDAVSGQNWTVHGSPTVVADPFSVGTTHPTVTVQAATSVTASTATLNGNITNLNSGGNATVYGFNYGLTTSYGQTVTSSTGSYGTGAFSLNVTGLAPGITYHYQATATNPGGPGLSGDQTFTTSSASPANKGEVLYDGPNQLSSGSTNTGAVANLFDANANTSWASSTNAAWAGIDCGAATTLTRIIYSPLPGQEDLVIGCTLNGDLSDDTFASPALLYTFPNTGGTNGAGRPNAGLLLNEIDVSPGTSYQYYMVQAGASSVFSFADIDFMGTWASGVYSQPVAPTITPPGGNYDQPTVIRMSSTTTSATIYYTLDGSTPTTSSTQYTAPFKLSSNTQINAIAYDVELSTPTSRVTTAFFFCPSVLYNHEWVFDNRNAQLQGRAGCMFLDPVSNYWYWYSQVVVSSITVTTSGWQGLGVYKSADFRNWTYAGNICGPPAGQQNEYTARYTDRAQVFYNTNTQMYVLWGTQGSDNDQSMSVWTSTTPDGTVPWTLTKTYKSSSPMADGNASGYYGDIGSFTDPVTGFVYLIYNWSNNTKTAFSQLDPANYTNTLSTNHASYTSSREAHTLFYYSGTYFWLSSGQTGFAYNENTYQTSTTPIGPWSSALNPFIPVSGAPPNTLAYNSQTDQVLAIPGRGPTAYIWLGDDFASNSSYNTQNSSKLMLPVTYPTSSTAAITWQNSTTWFNGATGSGLFPGIEYSPWNLDTVFPTVSGAPLQASGLSINNNVATWTNNYTTPAYLYFDSSNDNSFATGVISEVLPYGATSFTITPSVQTGKYFRVRAVNLNGTSNSTTAQNNPIVLVGITKHADKFLKLSNISGVLVTQLFPLATLQAGGFETFQQFAQYIGWDTQVDIALAYFDTLP